MFGLPQLELQLAIYQVIAINKDWIHLIMESEEIENFEDNIDVFVIDIGVYVSILDKNLQKDLQTKLEDKNVVKEIEKLFHKLTNVYDWEITCPACMFNVVHYLLTFLFPKHIKQYTCIFLLLFCC